MAEFPDAFSVVSADMQIVHRRVVRVGAAASWFAAFSFVVIGVVVGNSALVIQGIAPVLIGAFMTGQVLARKENAYVGLVVAAATVTVFYVLIGNNDTIVPAAVALVIICALATVFVESHMKLVLAAVATGLFSVPYLWPISDDGRFGIAIGMSLSFVAASTIFVSVKTAISQLQTRFQMLFEKSPAAVMEEDWSEAVAYVRSEYAGRPDRIRQFLMSYPAVVKRAVAKAIVLRVNRAAVELFEARADEVLLGPRTAAKVTDENLETFVEALVTLYEGREHFEGEILVETYLGRPLWLQVRAVDTSPDETGSRVIMGLADITHIHERNEEMSRLVRAKDEFIARVSHELRTPLTAVVGLTSELASIEEMSPDEQRDLLQLVAGQAAEMSYIVEDLLVAARAEIGAVPLDLTNVDLDHELRSTIQGVGVRVVEQPDEIRAVRADPSRVRQILRNLLTNASRYGGPTVRVLAGESGRRVWVELRDDGEGVPEEMEEKIFEPYTTAHEGVTGSVGLGLSVARQLANMMNGSLTYARIEGETVFRLELPAAPVNEPAMAYKIS